MRRLAILSASRFSAACRKAGPAPKAKTSLEVVFWVSPGGWDSRTWTMCGAGSPTSMCRPGKPPTIGLRCCDRDRGQGTYPSLREMVQRTARAFDAECAIATSSSTIEAREYDSHPAVILVIACGRTKADGMGRNLMIEGIEGHDELFQLRHILRLPAVAESRALTVTPETLAAEIRIVKGVHFCTVGTSSGAAADQEGAVGLSHVFAVRAAGRAPRPGPAGAGCAA